MDMEDSGIQQYCREALLATPGAETQRDSYEWLLSVMELRILEECSVMSGFDALGSHRQSDARMRNNSTASTFGRC